MLPSRLGKCGLRLTIEKTRRLLAFGKRQAWRAFRDGSRLPTFDYLGFTHYWGRSRTGKARLKRKTSKKRLRRALVAPCTTTIRGLASEVVLEPGDDPVQRRSVVNLDFVESVSVGLLVERLGRLSDFRLREICDALDVATDCR